MAKDKKMIYIALIILAIYLFTKKKDDPYRRSYYNQKEGYAAPVYPLTSAGASVVTGGSFGSTATSLANAVPGSFDPSKGLFQIYNSMKTYPAYKSSATDLDAWVLPLKRAWDNLLLGASGVQNARVVDLAQANVNLNNAKAGFDAARRDYLNVLKKNNMSLLKFGDTRSNIQIVFTNPSTQWPTAAEVTTALAANFGNVPDAPRDITLNTATTVAYQMNPNAMGTSGYATRSQTYGPYGVPAGYAMNSMSGSNLLAGASVSHPRSSTGLGTRRNMLTGVDPRRQPPVNMTVDPLASYTPNNNPLIQGLM